MSEADNGGPGPGMTVGDLARSTRVTVRALRSFGLALAEIAPLLDGTGAEPRDLFQRQLRRTEEQLAALERLRSTLLGLSPEQLAAMQRERAEQASRLSPEELAEMNRRRQQMLPDGIG